MPVCITVHGSAPACRPRNAKLLMKFKHARTYTELQEETRDYTQLRFEKPYLDIEELSGDALEADEEKIGLAGSPTKVKKIENVVFQHKESKILNNSDQDIEWLVRQLIQNHIIG